MVLVRTSTNIGTDIGRLVGVQDWKVDSIIVGLGGTDGIVRNVGVLASHMHQVGNEQEPAGPWTFTFLARVRRGPLHCFSGDIDTNSSTDASEIEAQSGADFDSHADRILFGYTDGAD